MAEFRLSARAKADLNEIAEFTFTNSGFEKANDSIDSLEPCCNLLAERPALGAGPQADAALERAREAVLALLEPRRASS